MLQFKTTQRKMYRPPGDSRRDLRSWENYQILDGSMVSRQPQRNDNINAQLNSNFNEIKELLKDRKYLLKSKYESLLEKNKQRINLIINARDYQLKNEAKMLNDRSIMDLVDQAQSLNRSKHLLTKVSEIRDINSFAINQGNIGKQFWARHKEYEKDKKKKLYAFQNNNKTIKQLQQKQRTIFYDIQKRQIQMVNLLTRNRNDPNLMKTADNLNEQIEKRKNMLRQLKSQKNKVKSALLNVIDDLLQFNKSNQHIFERRMNDLSDIFAGSENMNEFQSLMVSLQKMIINKSQQNKVQNIPPSAMNFNEIFRNYDIVFQQIERIKEDEDQAFGSINQELKQNVKNSIMQKIFMGGIPLKQDYSQLLKKFKEYRKILLQMTQQRPRLKQEIVKVTSMNSSLIPIKKGLNTEETRRQELKRQLKKLCVMNSEMQAKEKQQRNYNFNMQQLLNRRRAIQIQINDSAEKANLTQYKNKMKQLQQVNKIISQKNDSVLNEQIQTLRRQIEDRLTQIYDQYDDLVKQIEMHEQQPSLGVFITKLQKRLSLI